MRIVIIDTNALMAIDQFKVDIFSELENLMTEPYEAKVVEGVIDELENIAKTQKGKHKQSAKLALQIIKEKGVEVIKTKTHKNVDELLVNLAENTDYVFITQDKALKERLRLKNAQIITLRQKKYLKFI